ncbi:hypothetical protein JCM1841_006562 [Sporobolomyces salmonicolor]
MQPDPPPDPPPPAAAPTHRSDSFSSLGTAAPPPPSTTPGGGGGAREASWRAEEALLKHQLRAAKAEILSLQSKLGIKSNAAPFNSTSPRKVSLPSSTGAAAAPSEQHSPRPTRKASSGDLSASCSLSPGRVSATPEPGQGASPRSPSSSPRTPLHHLEGAGPVAMNRALLSDDAAGGGNALETLNVPSTSAPDCGAPPASLPPSPSRSNGHLDPSSASTSPAALRPDGLPSVAAASPRLSSSSENPFFGSGAARERLSKSAASAQSGSGRVISALQSDLLQARTALEATRGQLRLSQRAVDFLGRQNEDLKETKDRLTTEIDSLHRQFTRKERLQEEALGRARVAEAALAALREEHRSTVGGQRARMKEIEEAARRAGEAKAKAESEYTSLREGMKSMSEGWRADLKWLRSDLAKSEKDLDAKSSSLSKALSTRSSLHSTVRATLATLEYSQSEFIKSYTASTASALKQLQGLSARNDHDSRTAERLAGEFTRLRRNIQSAEADAEAVG